VDEIRIPAAGDPFTAKIPKAKLPDEKRQELRDRVLELRRRTKK
jgi:hypothetical protein